MEHDGLRILRTAPVHLTRPIGPSRRRYANSAALVETALPPGELLDLLKRLEAAFGPRRGQRWSARVLDCDIILWSGGTWSSGALTIPHVAFRDRIFVLGPALAIAPRWRDPLTGKTMRHLHARLTRPRPALTGTPHATPRQGALSSVGRATDF